MAPCACNPIHIRYTSGCHQSYCKWPAFRHAKITKLSLGQSVDGIYLAHLSEMHNARFYGHDTTQLVPRTPKFNVDSGNIYSTREDTYR